ncbi:MAG: TolC family protein [Acidobacteriota bacterium]|nr:TolC family protein [Acidobacteriota bacterium]
MRISVGATVMIVAALLGLSGQAQQPERQSSTLRGTVEQVDLGAKQVRVAGEAVAGGMGAMTMSYGVDQDEVLTRVKPGDHITATLYEGDATLHDVRIVAPVASAAPTGLHLEDFEKLALANNPAIAQGEAQVRASAGLARQAGLYPNPTAGYYGDEIRGGYYGGGKQGGFISQTIVTGGKLRAARRVAELATEEAKTTGEAQRLRLLNNVRLVFYQALAAQRLVEVRQSLAGLAADAAQTSRQLANVGQADRPDVLQAEVEQQQAVVSLAIAQQNLRALWRTLAAVTGRLDLPQTRVEGDLEAVPELNYDEWLATTLRDSPRMKLAQQAADRAEASVAQARKVPIPDLQLYGNLTQNYEPQETTHKPIGLNGGVQIGVQLPIFNRNQGGIAAARGESEAARQEVVRVKLQIVRDVAGLFRDYDSARATVRQYREEMLPRAEQAYQLYEANYKKMAAAYPQALIAQRTLFQLQVDYVQALESAWQSALEIRGLGLMDR